MHKYYCVICILLLFSFLLLLHTRSLGGLVNNNNNADQEQQQQCFCLRSLLSLSMSSGCLRLSTACQRDAERRRWMNCTMSAWNVSDRYFDSLCLHSLIKAHKNGNQCKAKPMQCCQWRTHLGQQNTPHQSGYQNKSQQQAKQVVKSKKRFRLFFFFNFQCPALLLGALKNKASSNASASNSICFCFACLPANKRHILAHTDTDAHRHKDRRQNQSVNCSVAHRSFALAFPRTLHTFTRTRRAEKTGAKTKTQKYYKVWACARVRRKQGLMTSKVQSRRRKRAKEWALARKSMQGNCSLAAKQTAVKYATVLLLSQAIWINALQNLGFRTCNCINRNKYLYI